MTTSQIVITGDHFNLLNPYSEMLSGFKRFSNCSEEENNDIKIIVPFKISQLTYHKIIDLVNDENITFIGSEWFSSFCLLRYLLVTYKIWKKYWICLIKCSELFDEYNNNILLGFKNYENLRTETNLSYIHIMSSLNDSCILTSEISRKEVAIYQPNYQLNRQSLKNILNILENDFNISEQDYHLIMKALHICHPMSVIELENYCDKEQEDLKRVLGEKTGHHWIYKTNILDDTDGIKVVIAGGSLISSIFDLKIEAYSDIDIWITGDNYSDKINKWYELIVSIYNQCPQPTIIAVNKSIATLIAPSPLRNIQIILTKYSEVDSVIKNFDMDYLMALISSSSGLRVSLAALEAWDKKTATPINLMKMPNNIRLAKAFSKGFNYPQKKCDEILRDPDWLIAKNKYIEFAEGSCPLRALALCKFIYNSPSLYNNPEELIKSNYRPTTFNVYTYGEIDKISPINGLDNLESLSTINNNILTRLAFCKFKHIHNDFRNDDISINLSHPICIKMSPVPLINGNNLLDFSGGLLSQMNIEKSSILTQFIIKIYQKFIILFRNYKNCLNEKRLDNINMINLEEPFKNVSIKTLILNTNRNSIIKYHNKSVAQNLKFQNQNDLLVEGTIVLNRLIIRGEYILIPEYLVVDVNIFN